MVVAVVGLVVIQVAIMLASSRFWGRPPTLNRVMGSTFAGIGIAVVAAIAWGNLVTIPDTNSAFVAQLVPMMGMSVGLVTRGKAAVGRPASLA